MEDLDLPPAPALITFRSAYAYMAAALKRTVNENRGCHLLRGRLFREGLHARPALSSLDEDVDINGGLIRRFLVKKIPHSRYLFLRNPVFTYIYISPFLLSRRLEEGGRIRGQGSFLQRDRMNLFQRS